VGTVTPLRELSPPAHLEPHHDISGFDCGNQVMNDWLRDHARTSEGRYIRTYVVGEGNTVVGYYGITSGSVQRRHLPKKMKEHGQPKEIPVALIARLARDDRYRAAGLGGHLLRDALKRAVSWFTRSMMKPWRFTADTPISWNRRSALACCSCR
jgi:hypothetical protein